MIVSFSDISEKKVSVREHGLCRPLGHQPSCARAAHRHNPGVGI